MSQIIITFGFGHYDKNGSLDNCYTRIEASNENEARGIISKVRGDKWCASYPKAERDMIVSLYGTLEVPFSELTPQGIEGTS